jgi:type II secretory pathway pseudopilin PulG
MRFSSKPSSMHRDRSCDGQPASPVAGLLAARRRNGGFTFAEVLIAILIVVIVFGAIITGYLTTSTRCQWTAYSLAAQSLGLQTIEQARSATWDISSGNNQLTNLNVLSPSYNSGTLTFTG